MEKENYTAYDLEKEMPADPEKAVKPKEAENPEPSDEPEQPESPEAPDPAQTEIEKMIGEMGAAKVLQLIRGNRNAAIEQIMTEVEQQTDPTLQSGVSVSQGARSIFDLARMA